MPDTVRVRFAPSPTGEPHIGNIRTALFNWLFARHHGGAFILRIEDTDQNRLVPGALEAIRAGLRWLGLQWDEGPEVGGPFGPYFQSRRLDLYREAAARLVAAGAAYPCYCSPERLKQMREDQERRKEPPRYDRTCRNLTPDERAEREAAGATPVVRFKIPLAGETTYTDLIHGPVTFDNGLLDDFVMLKSDGFPTYHLANVVDDHAMAISHVLRADEWVSSTPRHILLYEALGYDPPRFAHLPMILGPDRSKLSKRHGATAVAAYEHEGYLPEAIVNFLALLGWSLDAETEIIDRETLIAHFDIDRINHTPAIFNTEKLDWLDGVYIRKLSVDELTDRLVPFLDRDLPPEVPRPLDAGYVRSIVPLIHERLKKLGEAAALTEFFFLEDLHVEPGQVTVKGLDPAAGRVALESALAVLRDLPKWTTASLEAALRALTTELGIKAGQLFGLLRIAVTGRTIAPPLFDTLAVLGRDRSLRRIEAVCAR